MSHPTTLLFGIHMHQPVDNFKEVIDHAIAVCYAPFFEVMEQYPSFRFSVHCSGWLMEQIAQYYPRLFDTIVALAKRGSIELFVAGYYEPILATIPSHDRVAQIARLKQQIASDFEQTPQGLWLTERVWESSLIPDLVASGVKYTVIDDYHFSANGFKPEQLDGYYMTEEGGDRLGLFPISQTLRYALPFSPVVRALEAIKSYGTHEGGCAIIFDDAEKFGMWPNTFEWVYEQGWLREFVEAVIADEQIETMHYRDYFASAMPRGIAYLPNLSYEEMGEWSLCVEDAQSFKRLRTEMESAGVGVEGMRFLKGATWKNFFVKYPESNRLHKRMLELSKVRSEIGSEAFDQHLYRLQTNDALWHGVFGGLYLPNLRDNAYRFLIEAEVVRYGGEALVVEDDNEMDGHPKIKVLSSELLFRFDGACGGQLVEFDHLSCGFNWQNTLTRRKELYHQALTTPQEPTEENAPSEGEGIDTIHTSVVALEEGMREALYYDWYLKNSFIDHITDEEIDVGSLYRCDFSEYGDFANQPFRCTTTAEEIVFEREGGIYHSGTHPTTLHKSYQPHQRGFEFVIGLETTAPQRLHYALELNLHFASYEALRINQQPLGRGGELEAIAQVVLYDGYLKRQITLTLSQKFRLLFTPIETLSQSEKGFDLTIQGVGFVLVVPFEERLHLMGSLEVSDV